MTGCRHLARDCADVRYRPNKPAHHRTQGLHELVLCGPFSNHHRQIAARNGLGCADHLVRGGDERVQIVLESIEITVVRVGDRRGNNALRDVLDVLGGDAQRPDDGIERIVDAFDDIPEFTAVLGRISAGGQLALHGRAGQRFAIVHQSLEAFHHPDDGWHEFVAVRSAPDFLILGQILEIALRDLLYRFRQMANPLLHEIHGSGNVSEDTLMLSLHPNAIVVVRHPSQYGVHFGEAREVVNPGVQIVLESLEFPAVSVGDPGGNVALIEALHVTAGQIERSNDGIQHAIDALHHFTVDVVKLLDSAPLRETAFPHGCGYTLNLLRHAQQFAVPGPME